MENPDLNEEKIVQVVAPHAQSETKSLIFSIAVVAFVIGITTFTIGFTIGKINLAASNSQAPKVSTPSAAVAGWEIYSDNDSLFSISHPKEWGAKKHETADYEGVRISTEEGYVDLWLLVDQPFLLGEKHKKVIESEEEIKITIDGIEVSGTNYNYKAGNFFIVLVLPSSENTPQVTFWLEADDDKIKEEVTKIVESFQFSN